MLSVAEMTTTAVDENQMKLFSTSEYIRREQIASFFSRITASRRLGKHKGQSEVDDKTEDCAAEECLEELEAHNQMEFVEGTSQAIVVSDEEELDKEDDKDDEDNIPLGHLSIGDIREPKDKKVEMMKIMYHHSTFAKTHRDIQKIKTMKEMLKMISHCSFSPNNR